MWIKCMQIQPQVSGSSKNQHVKIHTHAVADRNYEYLINKSNSADTQTLRTCSIAHRYANL